MLDAIHEVHNGRRYLHRQIAEEIALHSVDEALTDREAAVLKLVAVGKANKQVAWRPSPDRICASAVPAGGEKLANRAGRDGL